MKALISAFLIIFYIMANPCAQAFMLQEQEGRRKDARSAASSTPNRKLEIRTIREVRGNLLITDKGRLRLAGDFRAYYRKKFGTVKEITNLNHLKGMRGTIQMHNGRAAWFVVKAAGEHR